MSLHSTDEEITLIIEDDGLGIDPQALMNEESLGLLGMRERVSTYGGQLHVSRAKPHGTVVSARLPRAGAEA